MAIVLTKSLLLKSLVKLKELQYTRLTTEQDPSEWSFLSFRMPLLHVTLICLNIKSLWISIMFLVRKEGYLLALLFSPILKLLITRFHRQFCQRPSLCINTLE